MDTLYSARFTYTVQSKSKFFLVTLSSLYHLYMRYLIYRKSTEQNRIVHIELRSNDLGKSEYILLTMTYVMYNLSFLSKNLFNYF